MAHGDQAWMDSLKRPPFGSRYSRGGCRLFVDMPLEIVDGRIVLPELILWARALNEGDLLIAVPSRSFESEDWKITKYLDQVSSIVRMVRNPWTFFESDVFHGYMGAMGPGGTLVLPDEAGTLVRPGESVRLQTDDRTESFTLSSRMPRPESFDRFSPFPSFFLEARYKVPLAPDLRVTFPEEALWALALSPGDHLAGKSSFATVDAGTFLQEPGCGKSIELELEPGGTLRLPESMRIILHDKPEGNALLTLKLSPQPGFQITQWVDGYME
jgi:hypothetical protein